MTTGGTTGDTAAGTTPRTTASRVSGPLVRYRVMAIVTGTLLLILVLVAVPLKYAADHPGPTAVVGVAHGFLFMVYLIATLDLGVRLRWNPIKLLIVMACGTIPFASFIAERRITREVRAAG
jgi:integral membrane protein